MEKTEFLELMGKVWDLSQKYWWYKNQLETEIRNNQGRCKALEYFESLPEGEEITLKAAAEELDLPVSMVNWASQHSQEFRKHLVYRKYK